MSRSGKPTSIQISRAAVLSVIGAETEKGKGGGDISVQRKVL